MMAVFRIKKHAALPYRQRRMDGNGFTYLGLLILIAVIALTSTATIQVGGIAQRRMAEEELLVIGTAFHDALISYAASSRPGEIQVPRTLQDLLKDPRFPNPRHHLRRIYFDPLTGKNEWGLVMAPDRSGIIGIYSLATGTPIKQGNFEPIFQRFTGKSSYQQWIFTAAS